MGKEAVDLFVRWLAKEPIGDTAIVCDPCEAAMDDTNPDITGKRTGVSVFT